MTHPIQDQTLVFAAPVGTPPNRRMSGRAFSDFYDRHAAALYSLAWLLFPSTESADDAFVTTMAGAGAGSDDVAPDDERRRLAAALWRISARHAPAEPARGHDPRPRATADRAIPEQAHERALLGLVMFGRHTYAQAADVIDVPTRAAASHLRSAVRRHGSALGSGRV